MNGNDSTRLQRQLSTVETAIWSLFLLIWLFLGTTTRPTLLDACLCGIGGSLIMLLKELLRHIPKILMKYLTRLCSYSLSPNTSVRRGDKPSPGVNCSEAAGAGAHGPNADMVPSKQKPQAGHVTCAGNRETLLPPQNNMLTVSGGRKGDRC